MTLRMPRRADAAHIFHAYAQDPQVTRYLAWRPHQSLAHTEDFIAHCLRVWTNEQSRPYVLTRREDEDTPVGMLDARPLPNAVDVGYVLQRSAWGTGLMTEALIAFSGAALASPDCIRVQATCDTENHASAKVLERSGFTLEGRLERHMVLPNLGAEPRPSLMFARQKG
ncbi:GNAT family N-acetyltransferase [Massilia sp. PAMC28688]|uniref:GNAT family N-acetyltransferase n=1 Tax=Massilia sp. PAMC28688 TaxID=2861283 RepID=UPI001C63199F|nr:GNAT family N-acetyltransferase [Massilia sp. PAMC28688]QYF93668.1 GNAT family N-acetyltransferase [Massilia sp. PAMC28688]